MGISSESIRKTSWLVVGRVLKLAFHDADTDPDTDFMRGKLRLLSWNIGVKSLGVRPQGRVWGF